MRRSSGYFLVRKLGRISLINEEVDRREADESIVPIATVVRGSSGFWMRRAVVGGDVHCES